VIHGVILRLRAQGLCAHELFVLADHDFGMDLVIDGRMDPGQQEIDTALPQFPKLLQSRLREDHVSGGARSSGRGNIKAE
jgi:hypothetical protein